MALRSFFPFSIPDPAKLPRHLLTSQELEFVGVLMPNAFGLSQPLFTGEAVAKIIISIWSALVGNIAPYSLYRNFLSGEKYADREYYDRHGKKKGELFLFRKGLLRGFAVPCKGARFRYEYGYPRARYPLHKRNFLCPHPPHDAFGARSFKLLSKDVGGNILSEASPKMLKVPHGDGQGIYHCDKCYKVRLDGEVDYWWIEIHTGAERYDEQVFLRRLLTMEQYLATRENGHYVVLVPFPKDVVLGETAIKKYNEEVAISGEKPFLELRKSHLLHYKQIAELQGRMGLYKHKKR